MADQFELQTLALNEVMPGRAVVFLFKAGELFDPDAPPFLIQQGGADTTVPPP